MKKVTFLFVALAVILFGACSSSSKTPSGVAKIYLNHVKAENFDKAVKCIDDESMPQEQLTAIAGKLQATYAENGLTKFEILSEEIDGDNAKVEVKEFFKDGTDDTKIFKLRKNEKGDWKIVPEAK